MNKQQHKKNVIPTLDTSLKRCAYLHNLLLTENEKNIKYIYRFCKIK